MTERLYLADSHLAAHGAAVTASEPDGDGFLVTLDRSCLFPASGGQPCDRGTIGDAAVLDVFEKDGEVVHRTDRALAVGGQVDVLLDWARRFDHMQQHTGEHLLSYVLFQSLGAANVGFHMAESYSTIDTDIPVDADSLAAAVRETNALITKNLPISAACYASEDELAALPLRKHAEGLVAPIRVVSIEGADACTCCAPHCRFTGEIGHILTTDAIAYKGGTRITFLCGARASASVAAEHALLTALARRFSTARENVPDAVTKLFDSYAAARRGEKLLLDEANSLLARSLLADAPTVRGISVVVATLERADAQRLAALASLLVGLQSAIAALFSLSDGQLFYTLASSDNVPLDMGELIQSVNAATGGKGGGRGTRAQGMARCASFPPETIEQLRAYVLKRLK